MTAAVTNDHHPGLGADINKLAKMTVGVEVITTDTFDAPPIVSITKCTNVLMHVLH